MYNVYNVYIICLNTEKHQLIQHFPKQPNTSKNHQLFYKPFKVFITSSSFFCLCSLVEISLASALKLWLPVEECACSRFKGVKPAPSLLV